MNNGLPPSQKDIIKDNNRLKTENLKLQEKIKNLESKIFKFKSKKPYNGGFRIE